MSIYNTSTNYGWLTIALHWFMALALIAMYFVGDYMVELGYYDELYHTLPHWHKSAGILLAIVLGFRLLWSAVQTKPGPANPETSAFKLLLAKSAHVLLNTATLVLIISGYLISTAKGASIEVFDFFKIPALLPSNADRGELAGDIHHYLGTVFILVVALHVAAALYHHFILKDSTLTRMLGLKGKRP